MPLKLSPRLIKIKSMLDKNPGITKEEASKRLKINAEYLRRDLREIKKRGHAISNAFEAEARKPKPRTISPERRMQISQFAKAHPEMPFSKIAEKFGVSETAAGYISKEEGVHRTGQEKPSPDQIINRLLDKRGIKDPARRKQMYFELLQRLHPSELSRLVSETGEAAANFRTEITKAERTGDNEREEKARAKLIALELMLQRAKGLGPEAKIELLQGTLAKLARKRGENR